MNRKPIQAHSKSEYKRLTIQGADVLPPAAPSPAPSKAEHGLYKSDDHGDCCRCGANFLVRDEFNAHLRAEVRRETLEKKREKSLQLAKFFRGQGDEKIAEQYVFMAEWLRSEIGK